MDRLICIRGYTAMAQTGIALGDSTSNYNTTRGFYSQAIRQGNSACNYKSDLQTVIKEGASLHVHRKIRVVYNSFSANT